jgi:hypothetical protein
LIKILSFLASYIKTFVPVVIALRRYLCSLH